MYGILTVMRVCKHIALARGFLASCMVTLACSMVMNPAKAEDTSFANENLPNPAASILNRFELSNDFGQVNSAEQGQVLHAYQQGLVTDNELSKFYPAELDKKKVKADWKKISFSMYETEEEKLYLDLRSSDRSLSLKYRLHFK